MKTNIVLQEEFLQHQIEVTITESEEKEPEFIPDSVKNIIMNQLSDVPEGQFESEETGGYSGTWRIIKPLDYKMLLRVVMWKYNCCIDESLTEELFIKYFGGCDGRHFYSKWRYTIKFDFMEMIGYFRSNGNKGQIFCNMVMEQINKYENRERNYATK